MAVGARDIGLTREQVHEWLQAYDGPFSELRAYLETKVEEANLTDEEIDVSSRSDIEGAEQHVVDNILADLGSYV